MDETSTPARTFSSFTLTSDISDWRGGPVVDSPLASNQSTGWMIMKGRANSNTAGRLLVLDDVPHVGANGGLSFIQPAAPDGWYLDTVAGTNPSRPVFTPPQMIQDLIELPRLIRDTGALIRKPKKLMSAKELANAHLAARFGWAPLIDDIEKLLNLQTLILKRNKELTQLYSNGGLRRRLRFTDTTETGQFNWSVAGINPLLITSQVTVTMVKKSWSTIRWSPTTPPPYHPSDPQMNALVRRLIFGLTPEGMAKGLWDVIPWTWLLGWFTNIGKYTLAYSNTVPAQHGRACFMSMVERKCVPGPAIVSGGKGNAFASGVATKSFKSRVVAGALTPGFNMPYLDISRLSILGSLAAQRLIR